MLMPFTYHHKFYNSLLIAFREKSLILKNETNALFSQLDTNFKWKETGFCCCFPEKWKVQLKYFLRKLNTQYVCVCVHIQEGSLQYNTREYYIEMSKYVSLRFAMQN